MRKYFKEHYREFLFVAVIFASLILILATFLLLNEYRKELEDQAKTKVELYTDEITNSLVREIDDYKYKSALAAKSLTGAPDRDEFNRRLRLITGETGYENLRFSHYYQGDFTYDAYDFHLTQEDPSILALRGNTVRISGIVNEAETKQSYVAVYSPVENCEFADGISLFYPVGVIGRFAEQDFSANVADSEFFVFANVSSDGKGEILRVLHRTDDAVQEHSAVRDVLHNRINDKETVDRLFESIIREGNSTVELLSVSAESYLVSIGGAGKLGGGFFIIGFYKAENVYASGYQFINTILGTLIIFLTILICFAIYFLISRRQLARRLQEVGTTDPRLDCPTQIKYERVAADILSRHKATQFAVIVLELKHYAYIKDNFGEQTTDLVLSYLKLVCSKSLQIDETYGYLGDGMFALFYHYRERKILVNRLSSVRSFSEKYTGIRMANGSSFVIRLDFGIYEIDRTENNNVHEMIDRAIQAKNAAVLRAEEYGDFKFYSESIHQSYIKNADIEVHMESALANKEFKVFFQPKYNISKNRPDGSEALVRWYDPEKNEYRPPALFMPLFEANGFVVKLDHYVYTSVCEYISEMAATGSHVYPVSVNVSRITAVQPDFLDFYVAVKKKFGIADRFITIEFTESFAYENYDELFTIINTLHKNGFLCSIDDFGSGYSSYNILKALPMDEIKLDKFFIERGLDTARDEKILSSVISVAKALGLKVTQEGVETQEELYRLVRLGCDVIQGYYYSKPLYPTDFETFLSSGGSIHPAPLDVVG